MKRFLFAAALLLVTSLAVAADKSFTASFTRLDTLSPAPQSPVSYRWYVNDVLIHAGTTGTNFTFLNKVLPVAQGDTVKFEMDLVNAEGMLTTYSKTLTAVVPPLAPVPDPGISLQQTN